MMMIAFHLTRFLTQVVHLANVRTTQRRFAPMLPHITGITGPLHRNTQLENIKEAITAWMCAEDQKAVRSMPSQRTPIIVAV